MTDNKVYKTSGTPSKPIPSKQRISTPLRLMSAIIRHIKDEGLTQAQAAKLLGVTQPRISNLIHGKIDLSASTCWSRWPQAPACASLCVSKKPPDRLLFPNENARLPLPSSHHDHCRR